MAVNVSWDDDNQTIIRFDYIGAWTWDEVYRALATLNAMHKEVGHEVNLIADLSHGVGSPSPFLSNLRSVLQNRPPGLNVTVFVGVSEVIMIFWNVLMRTYGRLVRPGHYAFAKTLKEARELIAARVDEAQPSL